MEFGRQFKLETRLGLLSGWHFLVVNYPSMPLQLRVFVDDHSGDPGRWIAVHEPMILPLECVR